MKESTTVNVAIVGLGYWGPKLAQSFAGLGTARVCAGCDKDERQLARFRQSYPQTCTTVSFDPILRDPRIDGVVIATPIDSHYALTRQALLSGKHVLVEKPMTSRASEADALVDLAVQHRRVLMVDHTYLYSSGINAVKNILEWGEIGDIYYIAARRNNFGEVKPTFSAMWELAPHDLAILIHLLGTGPRTVRAHGGCFLQHGIEDMVHLWLTFPRGIQAYVGATWLAPHKERQMTIVGSRGMLVYREDKQGETVQLHDRHVTVIEDDQSCTAPTITHFPGTARSLLLEQTKSLRQVCEHFVSCITQGTVPVSGGHQGRLVCYALEAAQRSLAGGGTEEPVAEPAYAWAESDFAHTPVFPQPLLHNESELVP